MRRVERRESKKGSAVFKGLAASETSPSPVPAEQGRELCGESASTEGAVSPGDTHCRAKGHAQPHSLLSCCGFPRADFSWKLEGKGPRRVSSPWERAPHRRDGLRGAQWIQRSGRKTSDTHTEGWRAPGTWAGVERSRRDHGLLAEARWPAQKPGCRRCSRCCPGRIARSQQSAPFRVMLGCGAGLSSDQVINDNQSSCLCPRWEVDDLYLLSKFKLT